MAKIKVRNFGPIKEGFTAVDSEGWIEIKKVTVFIGNQGTGKSTLAKLISTFTWIEKALTRGDIPEEKLGMRAFLRHLEYQNLTSYITEFQMFGDLDEISEPVLNKIEIEYSGDSFEIILKNARISVEKVHGKKYQLPQIVYIPSERSFLSYVNEASKARTISQPLIDLAFEFKQALLTAREPIILPLDQVEIKYQKAFNAAYIKGADYKLPLEVSSSGFQSIAPLYVVSKHLANSVKNRAESNEPMSGDEVHRFRTDIARIEFNDDLTDEQKRLAISVLAQKYNKTAFVNVIEEPEQNLYPTSQWDILRSLLEFNNMSEGSKLVMTTHSPYTISYLTLAVKAHEVYKKVAESGKPELLEETETIVPSKSVLNSADLAIYEINSSGEVIRLEDYQGLPSDDNYLNQMLEQSNILFSQLLDIEDKCL